jgi:NADPH:quinone reductase-like Zn-dependent oxidoreductase
VQIAKFLGAGKVIATGRNREVLASLLDVGADETICLCDEAETTQARLKEQFAAGVDVVVDYLWGESAKQLLTVCAATAPEATPVRFVQVGSMAGTEISLPAGVLRSSGIQLMGSGIGSLTTERLIECVGEFLKIVPGKIQISTIPIPLENVAEAWQLDDSTKRTVFVI